MYNIEETQHHFNELKKTVDSVKSLTGPVYDCGHSNQFQDIIKHTEKLQNLKNSGDGFADNGRQNKVLYIIFYPINRVSHGVRSVSIDGRLQMPWSGNGVN